MNYKNKKKLLFVVNVDWYFSLHWMARMCAAQKAGYDVHIITSTTNNDSYSQLKSTGAHIHPVEMSRSGVNIINEVLLLIKLFKLATKIRPTIIHAITMKPNVYMGLIAKLKGWPIVCSVTGLGVVFSRKSIKNVILKRIVLFICRLINITPGANFLFENSSDRMLFIKAGATKKETSCVISGAGVDVKLYDYKKENVMAIPSILFAARLLRDKGLDSLVKATMLLRNNNISVELKVAGIIDENAQNPISIEQIHQWESDGHMKWLGTINTMSDLISESSIICLPTIYGEGIPRILIEASACGRPIVTTNVSGCNEFVKDGVNGLLVEPGDTVELSNALERLILNYDLRKSLGENGRNLVVNKYTNEIVIEQTLRIYDDLLLATSERLYDRSL